MRAAHAGLLALALTSSCIRLGYDAHVDPRDPARDDAGIPPTIDAATDGSAASAGDAATDGGGVEGRAGADAGGADSGLRDAGDDDTSLDEMLGDTGLKVGDILGFYSGDWGDMVLREHDHEIWGVYRYDGGTITGEITDEGVFVGWWSQLPSRKGTDAGEIEFRWMRTDGKVIELDGRWRYGTSGTWLENWDITLVTDRDPRSELTDRFEDPSAFKAHP